MLLYSGFNYIAELYDCAKNKLIAELPDLRLVMMIVSMKSLILSETFTQSN